MRTGFGLFLVCLLAAAPAMAANHVSGKMSTPICAKPAAAAPAPAAAPATWQSQCKKPVAPSAFKASATTDGDDMNAMIKTYNDFATAAQNYMECVSGEAERAQTAADLAITTGAQKEIDDMKYDVNKAMPFGRYPQQADGE